MKRIASIILTLTIALTLNAQSGAVKKVAKSVFTLTTYKEDGSILTVTHGAYALNPGEGISTFKPFIGAHRASIVDASGKSAEVEAIIGANDMYDICRFKLSNKKTKPIPSATATASGKVWAISYSAKKPVFTPLTINSSEKFLEKYDYYILDEEITEEIAGCPIVTDAGQIIGLVQQASSSYAIHSTDCNYYADLVSSGLASHDAVLQKTHIRIALPADHEQARLMLMMINSDADSLNVVNTTNDYIAQYPDDIDGYSTMARYEISHSNLTRASQVMELATKKIENKDVALYEYANMIYNTAIYSNDSTQTEWTLDKAEQVVNEAISVKDMPTYKHLLAQIKYAKQDYQTALGIFDQLTTTDISNSEIFYEVAQCKSHLGASKEEILPYLDKAVEACPKPLTKISAPYILARGVMLDEMEQYKNALKDYNLYDTLMSFRANADFYYTRYKCEVKVRQYQQAINDISHAAVLNPREVTYLAELASLQLRVGQYEQAIKACDLSFMITTDYADIYIIRGVALYQLGRKDEALEAMKKAKELGDSRADGYIEKYSKEG